MVQQPARHDDGAEPRDAALPTGEQKPREDWGEQTTQIARDALREAAAAAARRKRRRRFPLLGR